jgi:hypothetical protein
MCCEWLLQTNHFQGHILTGGAILSCPKCKSRKNIICLAGGIVFAQTQQIPLYCESCNLNFIAIKKKGLKNESQRLSFEVVSANEKQLRTQLSYRPNDSKRFGAKRQAISHGIMQLLKR